MGKGGAGDGWARSIPGATSPIPNRANYGETGIGDDQRGGLFPRRGQPLRLPGHERQRVGVVRDQVGETAIEGYNGRRQTRRATMPGWCVAGRSTRLQRSFAARTASGTSLIDGTGTCGFSGSLGSRPPLISGPAGRWRLWDAGTLGGGVWGGAQPLPRNARPAAGGPRVGMGEVRG